MPHRRLAALPLGLLATAALAAGCAVEVKADGIPVPFSVAPTPSASAGVPKYVCTAAYKILTDGAVHLAGNLNGDEQGLRDTFNDMAGRLTAEADGTSDAELSQALRTVAGDLTTAAKQDDPAAYAKGGFSTVGQKLDQACA